MSSPIIIKKRSRKRDSACHRAPAVPSILSCSTYEIRFFPYSEPKCWRMTLPRSPTMSTTSSTWSGRASSLYSRSGFPATSSIGFGTAVVSSSILVPRPAARMTACIVHILAETQKPACAGFCETSGTAESEPSPRKTLVVVRDLGTNSFDRSRSGLFAAQTKREPEAQCERDDDTGEKGLHEFRRDAELIQNRKDGSDPDRVLRDRPG